ncbi:RIP metalloprotease [Arcanobacterium sp. S3PF19]|uniref:M50 family metallopeptidase n=1 Tax=Arcanobacterium sp. S3PF19 TaxID=1219585 RepID=UPI00050FA5DF|nr:site-2 protease family protein [Arcanobacterium sp. S3PF19]KGF05483.1 hypothetical protein HMPREF1631_06705 [Arcanobacterium sp. S3PF19]
MLCGIILFILGLVFSVALHEFGHLLPAKKFGVKVPQYFIGFGPTVFSKTYRGTQYGLKWIPLGGYVSIAGMLPPAGKHTKTVRANGELTAAEEARRESAKDLLPGEEEKAFWRLSPGKKLVVMCGGTLMNLLLSLICFTAVFAGFGVPVFTNKIGAVAPCLNSQAKVCSAPQMTPAAKAGLKPGDVIVRWNTQNTENWQKLRRAIAANGERPASLDIIRDGRKMTLGITPRRVLRPVTEKGKEKPQVREKQKLRRVPFVGVSPAVERIPEGPAGVAGKISEIALSTGKIVFSLPGQLWKVTWGLFTGAKRDPEGVVGLVGVADMAGSITAGANPGYTASGRAADLIMLLGSLNMSLFVFNLLPLLPLDGGHALGAAADMVRGRMAKIRRRPPPPPFDTARMIPLSRAVICFFIVMTLILAAADLINPVM